MIDNDMTNILKNFASAGNGEVTDASTGEQKVNTAAQEKNAMKSLLEGLDAQQKSVNQMPGQHKMAPNGAKHPASKYLVGGEFDDDGGNVWSDRATAASREYPGQDDEYDDEEFRDGMRVELKPAYADSPGEVFTLSNWDGRKGWIGDADGRGWGVSASQIMPAAEEGDDWDTDTGPGENSDAWNDIEEDSISKRKAPKTQMNKKQSFKDIFRSMDETEDDMATRFKKELHDEKSEKVLNKGDNGKFNLAERFHDGEELSWGDELLEDLKLLLHDAESYEDLRDGILSAIQQYEA